MNYKISIITPFHNVDMELFEECVRSMHNQSIGFNHIQWIIVVHNSEPQYMPKLKEIFKDDANVVLEKLDNSHRTPSSPRNHGIALATAPYIGLLDGDDRLTENCIEEVYKNLEETKADLLNVRREPVLTSPGLYSIKVKMLFNNTERRSIIEKDHWDTDKMFGYVWGMSTTYFIRKSLLDEHHITFDTNVLFAEDFLFILHCIANARRICYLNQFIGYQYIINENSLVQNPAKPAATVLTYAKGYKLIFDTMTKYGIDYSFIVARHMSLMANFILHSPDMTAEIRMQLKEILGPYLISHHELPSNKLQPKETLEDKLQFASEVILNPEKTMESLLANELDGVHDLRKLLLANLDTDIAQRNDFKTISTLDAWQFRMPLTNERFYRPLIELQARVGEDKLLTHAPVSVYFRTATGALLPCTEEHLRPYHEAMDSILRGHHSLLMTQSMPIEATTNDGAVVDTLHSAMVKAYFKNQYMRGGVIGAHFAAPVETYFAHGNDALRHLVTQSLADTDSDQIVAATCDEVVRFFKYLELHWQEILPCVPCSDERRAELESVFSGGFDKPVAKQIWGKLNRIVAFGSGEYYQSVEEMRRFTGDIAHNHGYYFTEEAILGKATADDSQIFECIKGDSFYELIPLKSDTAPVCWTQVRTGDPYQLVVTNRSGLYRYVTDHFICPQKVSRDSIKFTIY